MGGRVGRALERNNVEILGNGPRTILFAHGLGADQTTWRRVAPAFCDRHRVVLFDYVGCGRAAREAYTSERYSRLEDYARDVIEICDEAGLQDVVFVGHSISSMIGILASIERPGLFEHLVFLAPSPRYLNAPNYIGGFEARDVEGLLALMDNNFLTWATTFADVAIKDPIHAKELRDSFCATDARCLRDFATLTLYCDMRARLAEVRTPTLVVQCTRDDIVPTVVGEFVHHHIPGSQYRLIDVPGHCPQLTHPQIVTQVLEEYLKQE